MRISFALLLVSITLAAPRHVYAQELTAIDIKSNRPAPRMGDGHPDFSGTGREHAIPFRLETSRRIFRGSSFR